MCLMFPLFINAPTPRSTKQYGSGNFINHIQVSSGSRTRARLWLSFDGKFWLESTIHLIRVHARITLTFYWKIHYLAASRHGNKYTTRSGRDNGKIIRYAQRRRIPHIYPQKVISSLCFLFRLYARDRWLTRLSLKKYYLGRCLYLSSCL